MRNLTVTEKLYLEQAKKYAQELLFSLKKKTLKGKELERMREVECAVQYLEAVR